MKPRAAIATIFSGLLTAGLLGITAPSATAAPEPLKTRADFNTPGKPQLRDHVEWLIKGSKSGATIQLTQFRLRDEQITNALASAAKRGVRVQVLVDYLTTSDPNYKSLATELKKHPGSWARDCGRKNGGEFTGTSCNGDNEMHNKFYLFSKTRGKKDVVVAGTANLSKDTLGGTGGWNSLYTDVGNSDLRKRYSRYFTELAQVADGGRRPNPNYYDSNPPKSTGNTKTYFFPRTPGSGRDTVYNTLKEVKCRSAWGATEIRIGMWSVSRTGISRKLSEKAGEGCKVYVIVNQIQPEACKLMTTYRPHPLVSSPRRVKLKIAADDKHGVHTKDMTIGGHYVHDKTRAVFTGSQNFNYTSRSHNDENTIRILNNKTIYNAYVGNLSKMWHATNKPVVTPSTCPANLKRSEIAAE